MKVISSDVNKRRYLHPGVKMGVKDLDGFPFKKMYKMGTLQGTITYPPKWHFEDDFPFSKVGYVNSLEGTNE